MIEQTAAFRGQMPMIGPGFRARVLLSDTMFVPPIAISLWLDAGASR